MESSDDEVGRVARGTKAAGAKAVAEARKTADAASENLMVMMLCKCVRKCVAYASTLYGK